MHAFSADRYLARRKVLSVVGAQFHVWDERGQLAAFVKQKAFKLREDIRVYADEAASEELLVIQARSAIDVSASYDVVDAKNQTRLGTLRRRGLKSLVRDEWDILDADGREIGSVREDSAALALLRRLVNVIPQRFEMTVCDRRVGFVRQSWNPLVHKLEVDFSMDPNRELPRALGLAAVVLLLAIEGRQQ